MLSNTLYTSRLRLSLHNFNGCLPKPCWSLWNIHCSKGNESASFYVDYIFLVSITDNTYLWFDLTLWVTWRVSNRKQKLLKLRWTLVRLWLLGGVSVAHHCIFLMLCFVCLSSEYCVQCCQCLCNVHWRLHLRIVLMFILYLLIRTEGTFSL